MEVEEERYHRSFFFVCLFVCFLLNTLIYKKKQFTKSLVGRHMCMTYTVTLNKIQ